MNRHDAAMNTVMERSNIWQIWAEAFWSVMPATRSSVMLQETGLAESARRPQSAPHLLQANNLILDRSLSFASSCLGLVKAGPLHAHPSDLEAQPTFPCTTARWAPVITNRCRGQLPHIGCHCVLRWSHACCFKVDSEATPKADRSFRLTNVLSGKRTSMDTLYSLIGERLTAINDDPLQAMRSEFSSRLFR